MLKRAEAVVNRFLHPLAFLLPVFILFAVYVAVGMYPFGDNSLLINDMGSQYISYFSYLRNQVLLGGGNWLYTFSKALGGDMAGFSAYYLLSPFNLVLLFFPTPLLPVGVMVLTLLKTGCCGLCMSLLLNSPHKNFASLAFSIPYALMDYAISYQQNIMWLDGVMLLPIIILGIRRILRGKGPLCYILALAAAIITQYYIAYMLCIFAVIWFVVSFFFFRPRPAGGMRTALYWRPAMVFGAGSLIAGGLSAAVLLPALLSLQGGKGGIDWASLNGDSTTSLPGVLSRYLPGTARPDVIYLDHPEIYAGMLAVVCLALFFLNKRVPRRYKLGAGLLLGILLASFCVGWLDRAWHGLSWPVGFLFRYSFLFSFSLLFFAWQGFARLKGRALLGRLPTILAGLVFVLVLVRREDYTWMTNGKLLLGLGLAGAAALLLWLYSKKHLRLAALGLVVLVMADMGASALVALRHGSNSYGAYASFVARRQPAVEWVQAQDAGFYRMETTGGRDNNDPMLLGYRGLTHYSSSDKLFVRGFLDDLGFSDGGFSAWYGHGSTVAAESLLGVKYLISPTPARRPYTLIREENGESIYQNPYALPIGYMVSSKAAGPLPQAEDGNLFESHNALWRMLAPEIGEDLYRMTLPAETTLHNLTVRKYEGMSLYEKVDTEQPGWIEFTLEISSGNTLYMLASGQRRALRVVTEDFELAEYMTRDRHGILALGNREPGSEYRVRLELQSGEIRLSNVWFAYENQAALERYISTLAARPYQLDGFTSSRFDGTAVNENGADPGLMLLTIPYDAGWHASLDGERVPVVQVLGALCGVEVPAGSHRLQLWYLPPGLFAGLGISLLSLAALAAWGTCLRRKKGSTAATRAAEGPRKKDN